LETHLRREHKADLPDVKMSTNQLIKYSKLEEIPQVQQLIDSFLKRGQETLQDNRESIQSPKTVVPNVSHKRKAESCDHSMSNRMKRLSPNNERTVQQNTGKRPRGRPRKIPNCQPITTSSSLRKSTSISSSSTSRSQKSVNYDNEDINESSSSSGWNSDTEKFEIALSSKNRDSDRVKQYESQVNKYPNERQVDKKPPILVKQTGSQIKKAKNERLVNEKVGKEQRENDLNINQTELIRSECSINQNETNEEITDDSPLNSSETKSKLIESSEANASSSHNLPFIRVEQNLNEENMRETTTDLTSSRISASFDTINNQNIADNLALNSSYSGISRY